MITFSDLHIQKLDTLSCPETDVYLNYNENQLRRLYEPGPGVFIAESMRVIGRALDGGYRPLSLLISPGYLQETAAADPETQKVLQCLKDAPIYTAEESLLSQITGYRLTGGVLCAMQRNPLPDPKELLSKSKRVVILEGINNPTNVGAIFRSGAALGADCVLLTPDCSDPLYRRSARVSMGTVFGIPWTYFSDLNPGNERKPVDTGLLRDAGFSSVAMALTKEAVSIDTLPPFSEGKIAILLGNENEGLMPETLQNCDHVSFIPMREGVDSLNVAAASAVAFWALFHQNAGA